MGFGPQQCQHHLGKQRSLWPKAEFEARNRNSDITSGSENYTFLRANKMQPHNHSCENNANVNVSTIINDHRNPLNSTFKLTITILASFQFTLSISVVHHLCLHISTFIQLIANSKSSTMQWLLNGVFGIHQAATSF